MHWLLNVKLERRMNLVFDHTNPVRAMPIWINKKEHLIKQKKRALLMMTMSMEYMEKNRGRIRGKRIVFEKFNMNPYLITLNNI